MSFSLRRATRPLVVGLSLACLPCLLALTEATTLLRISDMETLVDESKTAVMGEVVEVKYGYDERQAHSTWVTVRVDDALFGDDLPEPGELFTFKMYGAPVRMPDGTRMFIDGTPLYREGDRYFLLLIQVSDWGFRDTAGMFQGAFRVSDDDGVLMAESLAGNHVIMGRDGLSRWIASDEVGAAERRFVEDVRGPLPYGLLRRAVARIKGVEEKPFRAVTAPAERRVPRTEVAR